MKVVIALALGALSAIAPAEARVVAVPTGQHAQVMNDIARAQQQNQTAIDHVQQSIEATRRSLR